MSGIFLILGAISPRHTVKARIADYGTDRDAYKVGDTATVRISIQNAGNSDITSVEVQVSIEKEFLGSFLKLLGDRIMLPIKAVRPGETEEYKRSMTIPNFPGKYRVSVKVIADGQEAGEIKKIIEVAR